jgi:hypothetical protein
MYQDDPGKQYNRIYLKMDRFSPSCLTWLKELQEKNWRASKQYPHIYPETGRKSYAIDFLSG